MAKKIQNATDTTDATTSADLTAGTRPVETAAPPATATEPTNADYVNARMALTSAEADALARFESRKFTYKAPDRSGNETTFTIPMATGAESLGFADVVAGIKTQGVKFSTVVVTDAEFGATENKGKIAGKIEPGENAVAAFLRRAGLVKVR